MLVFIVLTIVLAANAHPVYTVKNGEVTGVGEHYLNDMKSCCNCESFQLIPPYPIPTPPSPPP